MLVGCGWQGIITYISSKANHPGKIHKIFDMVEKHMLVGMSRPAGAPLPAQGIITSSMVTTMEY